MNGLNTFHSMGEIQCVTPSTAVKSTDRINRLKFMPLAQGIRDLRKIPIKYLESVSNDGLKNVIFDKLNSFSVEREHILPLPHLLWMLGKFINIPSFPGWTGFMANIAKNKQCSQTGIIPFHL